MSDHQHPTDAVSPFGVVCDLIRELESPYIDEALVERCSRRLETLAPRHTPLFITHTSPTSLKEYVVVVQRGRSLLVHNATRSSYLPARFPSPDAAEDFSTAAIDAEVS